MVLWCCNTGRGLFRSIAEGDKEAGCLESRGRRTALCRAIERWEWFGADRGHGRGLRRRERRQIRLEYRPAGAAGRGEPGGGRAPGRFRSPIGQGTVTKSFADPCEVQGQPGPLFGALEIDEPDNRRARTSSRSRPCTLHRNLVIERDVVLDENMHCCTHFGANMRAAVIVLYHPGLRRMQAISRHLVSQGAYQPIRGLYLSPYQRRLSAEQIGEGYRLSRPRVKPGIRPMSRLLYGKNE